MHLDMSGAATLAAVAMAALGWLAGVWLTRHPLADEIRNAGDALRRTALWGRLSTLP
jgi:hypothetical protein